MKRMLCLITLVAFAGCAKEEPAAPAPPSTSPPVAMKAEPIPAAAPGAKPPAQPPPAPLPTRPPSAPSSGTHLPAFTIRTMDHRKVAVQIDGESLTTPCLWSVTSSFKGESLDLGPDWPPAGARFAAKSVHREDSASKAEVYVLADPDRLTRVPGLRKNEGLLIVDGAVDGVAVRGALRLYVEGYRFTVYTPLDIPAGEDASKYHRTLWFERISDE